MDHLSSITQPDFYFSVQFIRQEIIYVSSSAKRFYSRETWLDADETKERQIGNAVSATRSKRNTHLVSLSVVCPVKAYYNAYWGTNWQGLTSRLLTRRNVRRWLRFLFFGSLRFCAWRWIREGWLDAFGRILSDSGSITVRTGFKKPGSNLPLTNRWSTVSKTRESFRWSLRYDGPLLRDVCIVWS